MEADPIKDLEIIAHVMTIAKTHKISTSADARFLYQKAENRSKAGKTK